MSMWSKPADAFPWGGALPQAKRLCCRIVLIALRETCIFPTARAATFAAHAGAKIHVTHSAIRFHYRVLDTFLLTSGAGLSKSPSPEGGGGKP